MFLASVCVFVTTYNLILPAISVDKNNVGNVSGLYLDDADSTNDDQDTPDEPVSDGITIQEPKIHMQKTPNSDSEHSENVYELSAVGDTYETVVSFDDKAGIPDGASLEVQEITHNQEASDSDGGTKYDEYIDSTSDTLGLNAGLISYARVFDISIVKDGEKVEPQGTTVDVRLALSDAEEDSEFNVVNFADGADEGCLVENTVDGQTIEFASDGSSVYVIVGTTIEKNVLASDGKNYKVTVTYGAETGIPEGAELEVEEILPDENGDADAGQDGTDDANISSAYDEYVSKTENALGMEEGSAGYIRLFDIKIVDKDDHEIKYQPAEGTTVDVRIELADKDSSEEAAASTQVVHFADDDENGDVIENSTDGQIVSFETSGFSIYAIVDSSKRLQYNFYDGTSLLISEYIKKQDNVLQELYDPGVEPEYGQTFVGWAYSLDETNPSNIYTIEELNQQAATRYNDATEELTEINVYAIYDEAWYLRYMDQDAEDNGIVLNVVRVRKDADDKTVTINYTYTPEAGIVFEGWMDVATGQTYQQGDTINLDHHVDLYVKLQGRNWLVFDSNAGGPGSGATYTPPQLLIGSEATTIKPDDPTRRGYTFTGWNTAADGTGIWWYRSNGSVNRFGNTLASDTTLYAQWEPNDTDYYVVFWKQKATDAAGLTDDAKEYDYVSSEHRTAKTGETVSITTADQQKGGTANREYGYYFTYNGNNSDVTATVDANGTTVLNVYYDRREITYNFTSNTNFTVPSYTGVVDGETVVLTPDGNGGYTYQKATTETTTQLYTGTRYNTTNVRNSNNPVHYGVVEGRTSPVQLDRRDNEKWYYDGNYISWGTRYYGTHYIVSNTGTYGWINGSMVALNPDGTYTATTTTTTTEPYTGEVTTSTTKTKSASFTGLYGATFSNWPDPGTNRVWTSTYNYRTLLLPLALTLFDPQAALDPSATQTTVNFTASNYSNNHTLTILVQDTNGQWGYTNDYVLTTANLGSNGTWYPTETFEGFTVNSYQITNTVNPYGTWTPVTSSGSFSYNNSDVFLRYTRNQHGIHFISQGNNVTGRTENIINGIYYESDLSKYAEGGSDYYEPTNGNEGYYFAGWYADPDCQIPFDFNMTMPDNDITVYAKWDTYRVRVVLVPTPDNAHNDEVEFANNQSLSFRLDYNEQVDDTNINSSVAKRPGYKLIGWYYSPDFDPATEVHFPVLINNNTPGVDMNYQSGEDWNKYGDNDGSHNNVRGILKLYAKWELDVDENSVYVEYDVDDVYRTYDTAGMLQTTIPVDVNKYALTNNNVTFQVAEAPTEYTSGFEFYRWVLLNPDGSESDIMYNPADTASEVPSSFIYEETITDDLGNTATIKKIRLKAKFNIETEKVTTVTFDGNGGVTNDSAQQERVTESYPINKDFIMKDEDSFVREGYTLIGWAFEREDGSKITVEDFKNAIATMTADELIEAGIYQLGQKVAADNLKVSEENNWDPLENTVYAVWEINKYTVTVKKVVDGDSEGKTFIFTATASDGYTLSESDARFVLSHGGTKVIENVPYNTILTFKETPASGYSIQSVDAKQTSLPDKTPLEDSAYIDLDGDDEMPFTIKGDTTITYTNEKAKEQKLKIHKIGEDAPNGLAGATFSLTSSDAESFTGRTGLVSMDNEIPDNLGYLPSGETDNTVFSLPIGTYTLSETGEPQYYDSISGAVTLSVTGEGISITRVGTDEEAPFEDVEISEAGGVYTLTVTNTRKKATVTIIKNVTGTEADKNAQYSFTASGLTTEDDTFSLYGQHKDAAGETPEQKNTIVYENIAHGTVFSVAESDAYTDFTTTITATYDDSEDVTQTITLDPERQNLLSTGDITVNGDITITYSNTRNKQPVAIYKTGLGEDETITTGASFVVYKASEYNDATQSANAEATIVAQGTTNENGILILDKLPIDTGSEYTEYRLVETNAPAGYILPDYLMKIFVYPDKVIGMQGTGYMLIKNSENYSDITDKSTTVLRVWNNPGVSLPSTGGPGTNLIYLLGILLTGIAGTGLVMRRRRRDAA